jgi:hypothetical protein
MKVRFFLAAATLFVAGLAQATLVSLVPSANSVTAGSQLTVDVVVTGLGSAQVVGGFDLDIVFDSSILSASGVDFGTSLGLDGVDQFSSAILSAGRIDFAAISLLSGVDLLARQVGAFFIARLTFDALAPGFTDIAFDLVTAPGLLFSDEFGDALPVSVGSEGRVTVLAAGGAVPTPGSLSLALLSLLLIPITRTLRPWA